MKQFDAAASVLGGVWFAGDYINDAQEQIDFEELRAKWGKVMSDGERVMVGVAEALYTGHDNADSGVAGMLVWLDQENLQRAVGALQLRAGVVL
jgi:hypothetical protein